MSKIVSISSCRVFLTGGGGFIGSHLIERLYGQNEITCYDNAYRGSNLEILRREYGQDLDDAVTCVKGDVRDRPKLAAALRRAKPDYVFHFASIAGVSTVIKRAAETIDVNVIGSHNLLMCLRNIRIQKLVFTSTSEVYGPLAFQSLEDGFTTQGSPYDPRWSYGTSKLFVEHMCVAFEREFGIPVAIGRLFNIYGPRQIGEGAIHNFIVTCLKNEPITIYGDGGQMRAWCYVDDCIDGLLLLCTKGRGVFNIGNPREALSIYSLALKIREKTNSRSKMVFREKPTYTDIQLRIPSINKISKLGYCANFDLDAGLHKTIEWYRPLVTRARRDS